MSARFLRLKESWIRFLILVRMCLATPREVADLEANRANLEENKAKANILMTHHMNDSLQNEYLNKEDPRKLWVELEEQFHNVHNSLLPYLEVRWNNLRLCDFKSILDYNSKALRIKSLMEFCEKYINDALMIKRTLSTFPDSAMMVAKNY
ncbi:uncharacterized protein LOC112194460 [Rosa chinensis]|uniref:uncharacterized protein LOC112194460 n=1 Tax=Rosa chinensis TaxID=74649 RepID=UPI000D091426|nr:uncharacterized protein LOC112194460 [Rosa chinensis]